MSAIRPQAADGPEPSVEAPRDGGRAARMLGGGLTVVAGLALLLGYAALLLGPVYANTHASDFTEFYYPAARLFLAGGDPYTVSFYVQPPALLLVFAPLAWLPLETARAAWLAVQVAMLAVGVGATLRALDFRLTGWRAALVLLVYLSPNVIWGLLIGQSAVLIFFLQALGLLALRANRPWLGGLLLGAVVLKVHLLAVGLPLLLNAPRRAWAGAAISSAGLLLGPEIAGIHLLGPFLRKLLPEVGQERYNKLNPADLFVNLAGGPPWLHAAGWIVLGLGGLVYLVLLGRVWRARAGDAAPWRLTPPMQGAMVAAYLFLPYTLAYDLILVAGSYLWRFGAAGYRLDRALTWNLGLLWLLPILTLLLHAEGVATTLNPLLIGGLLLLLRRRGRPA